MKRIFNFLKKRWWIILILLVVGWVIYGQTLGKKPDTQELSYKVKRQTIQETLTFAGAVDAQEKATLRFQTSGRLAWVGVKEGDTVKKYQSIASLDQRELKKQLEKDLIDYEKERLDYDNDSLDTGTRALPGDRYLRQDTIDAFKKAQFDLNSSVLDVELADIALRYSTLISPIDGVVVSVSSKQAGINVTPVQAEFVIVNPASIYFSASADQTDVVKLEEGMHAQVLLDAFPDNEGAATVTSISYVPREGESDTVYGVTMTFDNTPDPAKLRLAMSGDATFVIKEKQNAVAVPTTFIKTEGGKQYVWVKDKSGKRVKAFIETGEEIDIATEVLSGLEAGDVVYD